MSEEFLRSNDQLITEFGESSVSAKTTKITVINCPKFCSLEGVFNCTQLQKLSIIQTALGSLAKLQFCPFTQLTELIITGNNLRQINEVKHLRSLVSLQFNNNCVESLKPLQFLKNLEVLNFSNNLVDNVEHLIYLRNMTKLKKLICFKNKFCQNENFELKLRAVLASTAEELYCYDIEFNSAEVLQALELTPKPFNPDTETEFAENKEAEFEPLPNSNSITKPLNETQIKGRNLRPEPRQRPYIAIPPKTDAKPLPKAEPLVKPDLQPSQNNNNNIQIRENYIQKEPVQKETVKIDLKPVIDLKQDHKKQMPVLKTKPQLNSKEDQTQNELLKLEKSELIQMLNSISKQNVELLENQGKQRNLKELKLEVTNKMRELQMQFQNELAQAQLNYNKGLQEVLKKLE
ncbi:leucine-rich_repeat domain-containing protein [Hexamita inflata]|uniref:Leucine-rich repeat domain-containing protein n=1 Tax=Hexamita inflata TaxID=28002 RepID=A0AA86UND7_9EUKA|nr:leucine-rich repeat domain-containing protein [Hexamita inflata]